VLAAVAIGLAFAATDVEGYYDKTDRIACMMVKRESGATAVRCGAKGRTTGLLLGSSGKASRVPFEWRPDRPVIAHHEVDYGKTLYLYGGTAKLVGDSKTLRCTVLRKPSVRVRCRNRDGHEITVTRTQLRRS
jgi:hypothetical protein